MALTGDDRKIFSLREVAYSVKKTMAERYQSSFWVKAEMNKLNYYSYSGHCYPELVEKMEGKVVALFKATLWKEDFVRINAAFLRALQEPLRDGIRILFLATLNYDPVYGMSLRIQDIDPVFSLGELEREKLETIQKLKNEGVFQLNQALPMPLLPQRIAVISVETSKGYSDFLQVIQGNSWGYKFYLRLFPALLQGDKSVHSILAQLRRVNRVRRYFDVVAIIRGGGGDVGLSSYNHLALARAVATFPIPVLSGIGHSTNETVVEMVAHKNMITPTALAEYLLQKFHNFSVPVARAEELLAEWSKRILQDEQEALGSQIRYFHAVTGRLLSGINSTVTGVTSRLGQQSSFVLAAATASGKEWTRKLDRGCARALEKQRGAVDSTEKQVNLLDPVNVLKRGYTITFNEGRVLRSYQDVAVGDTLTTLTADGHLESVVSETKPLKQE